MTAPARPDRTSRLRYRWGLLLAGLAITALVAVGFVALRATTIASAIEAQTLAWRFQMRGVRPPPSDVTVIAIDDRTIASTGWPARRALLAEAVRRLAAAGAKVIALDLLLFDPDRPRDGNTESMGDIALRDALAAAGNTILAAVFTFESTRPANAADDSGLRDAVFRSVLRTPELTATPLKATGVLLPIAPLRAVAGLAHVNLLVPDDGLVRTMHAAIAIGDNYVPAMPIEVARRLRGVAPGDATLVLGQGVRLGERVVPIDRFNQLAINYYGPERTIPTFALIDLLEDRVPAAALAGRAVFLGASALGVGDNFTTPFSRGFPGVEILATSAANVISGQVIDAGDRAVSWSLVAIIVLGLASLALAQLPSPVAASLGVVAALVAWGAIAQIAFAERLLLLNATFPAAAVILNAGAVGLARNMRERRLRRVAERQRENLAGYHSPAIVELLAEGNVTALDDRAQDAAILFIDIAGSTGRAERAGAAATASFLHAFHNRIEPNVLPHRGVLEQISGDGAMILFGVPDPRPDDAAAALACAVDLVAEMERWSAELAAAGDEPLRIGVGIHYGPVVIARLGEKTRHVTAAGDTVNVANRIEALTRVHRATIAISAAVAVAVRAVGRNDLLAGFYQLPPQEIRGRAEPITVWVCRTPAAADLDAPKSGP